MKEFKLFILNNIDMKNKNKKRNEFNAHLNDEDKKIIDELMSNNINVSGVFKMFIKGYLEKIKQLNASVKY